MTTPLVEEWRHTYQAEKGFALKAAFLYALGWQVARNTASKKKQGGVTHLKSTFSRLPDVAHIG